MGRLPGLLGTPVPLTPAAQPGVCPQNNKSGGSLGYAAMWSLGQIFSVWLRSWVRERLFYTVIALGISFSFTLTMLLMVMYKMLHCIRILNTLLPSRIKWIYFSETVLNILTVFPSIPFTAYWMMTWLSPKNTMSLDRTYEILQSRNRIGRKKGLSQKCVFAHRSAVTQYQMKLIFNFMYIHLSSFLRAIFLYQIYRVCLRSKLEKWRMFSGYKVHLLHAPRLQVVLSSECFAIAAVG